MRIDARGMTMRPERRAPRSAGMLALALSALTVAGCQPPRSAQWFMAHGDEMQAKVKQCKADPQRASGDKECANAIEAFITWARATQQK
jgi:hypothetical protein